MIAKIVILAAVAVVALAQKYGAPAYGYGVVDDYKYAPQPYDFGVETNDNYGTTTFRKESGDGNGRVQGSYGYRDDKGIERVVDYVADEKGFRALVKTNEPGTDNQNPADVDVVANPVVVDYAPQKYAPAPQPYVAPRPVYAAPRPLYTAPGPVYAAPGPVYGAPVPVAPLAPLAPKPVYGVPRPAYVAPKVY